ncbi:MAG: GTP-binding protein [Pseudomonadota bacterium]
MTELRMTLGRDILRMKGVIETADDPECPRVLHVVGHIASPMRRLDGWPDGLSRTRLVMIVTGAARDAAGALLGEVLPELIPFEAEPDPAPTAEAEPAVRSGA